MSQAAIDYLLGQIVSKSHDISGTVKVKSTLLMTNGTSITGEAIRDINGFDITEAQSAADSNAIAVLVPGVEYILPK